MITIDFNSQYKAKSLRELQKLQPGELTTFEFKSSKQSLSQT